MRGLLSLFGAHPAAVLLVYTRTMHLLYLDDSGSAKNAAEEYLVLGGFAVYEAQAHWFTRQLDSLAESIDPQNPRFVEFHASEIFSRRKAPWKGMDRDEARGVIKAVLQSVSESYDTTAAFACAIHKASFPGRDPMEMAFEDLCSRFDMYLTRRQNAGDRQRGMIILDKSSQETSLQHLATNFRVLGTRFGSIRNLVDVPFFVDSKMSRLVQIADHIAYAAFRRYNAADSSYFDIIAHRFDQDNGVVHGLSHLSKEERSCMCPACLSRRSAR